MSKTFALVRKRVQDALPTTFAVHVVLTALAALGAQRVSAVMDALAPGRSAVEILDALEGIFQQNIADSLGAPLAVASLALLIGAPLQMAWLTALRSNTSVRGAFAAGLIAWPRAFAADLVLVLPAALLLALTALAPLAAHLALADSPNARSHDLGVLLALLLPLGTWLTLSAFRDLVRASLLAHEFVAGFRAAWRRLRPSLPWFAGFLCLSTFSAALAFHIAPSGWMGWILLQPVAFFRVLLRSAWLAAATAPSRIRERAHTSSWSEP